MLTIQARRASEWVLEKNDSLACASSLYLLINAMSNNKSKRNHPGFYKGSEQ